MKRTKTYYMDRFGNFSLMNLNVKTYLTENDYTEFEITDEYKYRLDKIANEIILNDIDLYFFIIWINNIYSFDDLEVGEIIKIPTVDFIRRVKKDLESIRGKVV